MARTIDAAIAELAKSQHSVYARRQALALGMTVRMLDRRIASHATTVVRTGVYAPSGAAETFKSRVMAAVLWGGDGAVASHRTAAELYGIAGIRSRDVFDVTVRRGTFPRSDDVVTHRSVLLGPTDVTIIDGIPVTRPVRTLIDSGLVVPKQALEIGLDDVCNRGYATPEYIGRHLHRLGAPLRPGSTPLLELMNERDPNWAPLESVLETMTWQLIADSDLPMPERQLEVVVRGKGYRIDMAYPPPVGLAIEPSGFRWHSGRLKWGIDKRREKLLVSLGYGILPVTWTDVTLEPVETLDIIRDALAVRGHI